MAKDWFEDLGTLKAAFVRRQFIETADENYITARWCHSSHLFLDFCWLSVHAIEKYLKAIILLNGGSARSLGHDIGSIYEKVVPIASDFLPKEITKHPRVPHDLRLINGKWRDEEILEFLNRLYVSGNEHNRYATTSFQVKAHDLYKVDAVIFFVRRLCIRLNGHFNDSYVEHLREKHSDKFITDNTREFLLRNPNFWRHVRGKLVSVIDGRNDIRDVVLDHNLYFSDEAYNHTARSSASIAGNSALFNFVFEPLEGNPKGKRYEVTLQLIQWIIGNVTLPSNVKQELKLLVANQGSTKP